MTDYTNAPREVRYHRLVGIFDDITNELVFVAENAEAHEALLEMVDEGRVLVRSLMGEDTECEVVLVPD